MEDVRQMTSGSTLDAGDAYGPCFVIWSIGPGQDTEGTWLELGHEQTDPRFGTL